MLESLAKSQAETLTVVKVDTQKYTELEARYNIEGYPSMVLFNEEGKEVHRMMGVLDEEAILTEIGPFMGGSS